MLSKLLFLAVAFFLTNMVEAQFVGVGTKSPRSNLDVIGNFHVRSEYTTATGTETAADSLTTINNGIVTMAISDSMIRIFDPGGPNGNYLPGLTTTYRISNNTILGSTEVELSIDEMKLKPGDQLTILKNSDVGGSPIFLFGFSEADSAKIKLILPINIDIRFTSNSDVLVDRGFNIGIKRLFKVVDQNGSTNPGSSFNSSIALPGVVAHHSGTLSVGSFNRMKGNFEDDKGILTVGSNNVIEGKAAIAIGDNNSSDSPNSQILGSNNTVETDESDNGGDNTVIGNNNSIDLGASNFIIGNSNTIDEESQNIVLGFNNDVTQFSSTFLGSYLSNSVPGNIVLGRYNESVPGMADFTTSTNPIFILGNGTSSSSRQNAMVTLRNGNTGIGINNPIARMHVREKIIADQPGASGLASLEFRSNGLYRGAIGYDQANSRFFFFDGESGLNTFFINNGRFGILRNPTTNALEVEGNASKSTAGSWIGNSDARLKKSITPIEGALDKLIQLQGITYEWNDTQTGMKRPGGVQYGFTAQNIQNVFPELVEKDAQGYLQTAYGTYDAMMVESIKELLKKVQSLEQRVRDLEISKKWTSEIK